MRYLTGEKIEIDDIVLIEHGQTIGKIYSIIETSLDMVNWGVEESGVIIEAEPFGLVMWNHETSSDPLIFKSRKA